MTTRKPFLVALSALLAAALACSGPGAGPTPDITATFSAALTAAFATAQAGLPSATPPSTQVGQVTLPPATQPTIVPATVVKPTDTAAPTNTPGVQGCSDGSHYVADVTIPDNTVLAPGQAFTKTWRIRNSGTCTWVGSYAFGFFEGSQMGGPGSVPVAGNVAPGSLYDVSVNLVAPASAGTYKGTWQMKNAGGAFFGTKPFVQIVVVVPTHTPVPSTATPTSTSTATPTPTGPGPVTVTLNASASGGVYSPPATVFGAPNAGDDESNHARQGFLTFDLSSIPTTATITAVKLDLSPYDQLGNPFSLGCLRVYQQSYGTLDPTDFFSGTTFSAMWRFCSVTDIGDPTGQAIDPTGIPVVQSHLASRQFQIRLQFNERQTNDNNTADLLRPTPKLIVTYTVP